MVASSRIVGAGDALGAESAARSDDCDCSVSCPNQRSSAVGRGGGQVAHYWSIQAGQISSVGKYVSKVRLYSLQLHSVEFATFSLHVVLPLSIYIF